MELDWFLKAKVDPDKLRRELAYQKTLPVVGKIARLFPLKGHDELMNDALKSSVAYQLSGFLIGDGNVARTFTKTFGSIGNSS
jgi:hypothetical protein